MNGKVNPATIAKLNSKTIVVAATHIDPHLATVTVRLSLELVSSKITIDEVQMTRSFFISI